MVRGAGARTASPLTNRYLTQKLGTFETIVDALEYAALGETGFDFYSLRGELDSVLPYRDLRHRAIATALKLLGCGLTRGDRVAVVAETGPDFMQVFFACQYAGLIACPLPYSMNFGGADSFVERIAGLLRSAEPRLVVTNADLAQHIGKAAELAGVRRVLTHAELAEVEEFDGGLEPFGAGEAAYIQYSSGSTSAPKGVLITQASATANVRAIVQHGLKIREGDRAFSWLPLYHDMGLVGFCLSPLMSQSSVDYLPTTAFARRPALWLKLMSENGCSVSYAPSFGYELAARRIAGTAGDLDLSRWRIAGIGGDMIRSEVLELFAESLAPAGFDRRAFLPSYGMAESTLAITFAEVDRPIRVDVVDRAQVKLAGRAEPAPEEARGDAHRARAFVVCGKPLPGHEVVVLGQTGERLGEREIGKVLAKGPSLMAGYFRNAAATAAVMREDGFMDTGDMGYWLDGEIVITGRAKDLILHNGRNIWPQDIEWAVERLTPLRSGDVAAFAVEAQNGEDQVVVLIECRLSDESDKEDLRKQAVSAVHRASGVDCEVVLVAPRSLPFTSSGKLSRAGAKARYLAGEMSATPLRMAAE